MVSSLVSATGPAAKRDVVPEGERMVKVRLGIVLRPEICTTMGRGAREEVHHPHRLPARVQCHSPTHLEGMTYTGRRAKLRSMNSMPLSTSGQVQHEVDCGHQVHVRGLGAAPRNDIVGMFVECIRVIDDDLVEGRPVAECQQLRVRIDTRFRGDSAVRIAGLVSPILRKPFRARYQLVHRVVRSYFDLLVQYPVRDLCLVPICEYEADSVPLADAYEMRFGTPDDDDVYYPRGRRPKMIPDIYRLLEFIRCCYV